MDLVLRRACAADWPSIAKLHHRSSAYETGGTTMADAPPFGAMQTAFRGDLWIAVSRERLLGFVAWRGNEICWLYVDPAQFRNGVGRALIQFAAQRCGPVAHIRILAGNDPVRRLCLMEGFAEVPEDAPFPGPPSQLMRRVTMLEPVAGGRDAAPIPRRAPAVALATRSGSAAIDNRRRPTAGRSA